MNDSPPRARHTVVLPAEPASAAAARRLLREVLADAEREDCTDVAELACTELVTNAVLHAHTPIELTIEITDAVRVAVRDFSATMPALRGYDSRATTGRGLALVAAITDEHGIADAGQQGKTIWFSLGGADRQRTDEELLAAWDDGWDLDETIEQIAAEERRAPQAAAPATRVVRFLQLPPTLWLATREHHDALLRELVLYLARHPVPGVDIVATDRARTHMAAPVLEAIAAAQQGGTAHRPVPEGHPSPLPWVPEPLDLELDVPIEMGPAFGAMQDTLDAAEHLARQGRLLARPGLDEVIALRDWLCEQVVAQLAGVDPAPWGGTHDVRFADPAELADRRGAASDAALAADLAVVRDSDRGVVAADDTNRIVAVSRPFARMVGWEVDELVGRRVVVLIPPELREAHVAGITRHLTTGEAHVLGIEVELPVLRVDGTRVACTFRVEQAPPRRGRAMYHAWIDPVDPRDAEGPGRRARRSARTAVGPGRHALGTDETARPVPGLAVEDYLQLFRTLPTPYMVMTPDLVIVEANEAYLATVGRTREEIVGMPVFEAFPPAPDALDDDGVPRVQRSFERARDTRRPHTMPVQKYDIPDLESGGMTERHWSLISIPVLDEEGRTALIAQRAEDITDFVSEREQRAADRLEGEQWRRRVVEVEADLYARARELAAVLEEKEVAARRLASLAEVAALLTSASSLDDLERIVVGRGLPVLGADGGAVVARSEDGWRVSVSAALPDVVPVKYAHIPFDSPLPAPWVARSGQRLLLPTRASGMAFDPVMAEFYADTQRLGWAFVPLAVHDTLIGALAVAWTEEHQTSVDELEIIEAFAAQLAQALERIRVTEAQQAAARDAQRLSETLQRSLLTRPPQAAGRRIAVRYQPAALQAQIGGDWYDAFETATGETMLVVGDVNGHDQTAAALMGQVRNLLRGMAYDATEGPARLLSRLDRSMAGLEIDTLVTAVVARLEASPRPGAAGRRRMRWSNAGHPPPVVRWPDGRVQVLAAPPELLLGLAPGGKRLEYEVELPEGSTVVLYTDGLVERRGADLDEGIARLAAIVAASAARGPEELADEILHELGAESREDDLALLVLTTDRSG